MRLVLGRESEGWLGSRSIDATRSVHSYDFDVKGPEKIYMNLTWRGRGPFTVVSIVITKVETCHVVECQGGWL